jgi:ornithine--oxo-acid transaminase
VTSATQLEQQYGTQNYAPLPVVLSHGRGCEVWDIAGRRYLDFMSAYSAVSHGHAHPRLLAVLNEQAGRLAVVSRAFHSERLGPFLERACTMTGLDRALPMNTGVEVVEAGLKLARRWAYRKKGVAADQAEIIACRGNFHGRTLGAIAMSDEVEYRRDFGPFPPGFRLVDYGDSDALEAAINPQTAAFLVEPIQGEGGIVVPPSGYLSRCAEICRRHDVLLIADEIQTGLGRTGLLLACDHEQVRPDLLLLGKALGGGIYPVSLLLGRAGIMELFGPGSHGSTFGGNPLAASLGLTALEILEDEGLVDNCRQMGDYLRQGLAAIDHPGVRAVRGRGLMLGMELDPARVAGRAASEALMEAGMLVRETHATVLRFAPPLIVTREQIDELLNVLPGVLDQVAAG